MENKVIIITGGNGNVGSYFAEKFLEKGEKLILTYRKYKERINHLPDKYRGRVNLIQADISNYEQLSSQLHPLIDHKSLVPYALIHTVSMRSSDFRPLVDSETEMWYRVLDVNLKGTYNILKQIIPYFRKYNYGRIVLFGSNITRIGLPRGSAYSAAKAGIANIGRCVAVEEAPHNILINTISPGPIMIDDSHFSESYRRFRKKYYKEKLEQIPLKRYAKFADIYGLCEFLISTHNTYITGEEFFVTGGKL